MKYYSHSKVDQNGKRFGSKELIVHNQGLKNRIRQLLFADLGFNSNKDEILELIMHIVDYHDFGKHTQYFQNYLLDVPPIDRDLKSHAQIGSILAYNQLKDDKIKEALISAFIIYYHHGNLERINDFVDKLDEYLVVKLRKQSQSIFNSLSEIEEINQLKDLKSIWDFENLDDLCIDLEDELRDKCSIEDYFFINYLFSLLIEGDKMDASDTEVYPLLSIQSNLVDKRFGKPKTNFNKDLKSLSNNELRNYCRQQVVSHIEDDNIINHYLFTLTAPTGIGKTMTALDFALKLKQKLEKKNQIESRIIYALPFINIIEQALKEYKTTLSDEVNILGHYQFADIFGNERFDNDELNYNQKLMLLDTWQADIVITSFVQFFETLLGNRNKLLKKFSHYANAIIILDEVQTLALGKQPLLGATLFYLTKFLKSRVILMTATRPKIIELANKEILNKENENAVAKELLTDYEKVFSVFNRTRIIPLLDELNEEDKTQQFVNDIFAEKWTANKSCLVVCNNIQRSVELYNYISNYLVKNNLDNPIYYLSTNIISAKRLGIIQEIKSEMKNAPILIATQVVEAGVDLDFDMGFRDIGPIDSIIQVAGRINRNNEKGCCPLYIIDFDSGITKVVYGSITYTQAKKALEKQQNFCESEYLQLITSYFDNISERQAFPSSLGYFESMKNLVYTRNSDKEYPIGEFRIIENSKNYKSVFIEIDENASELIDKYAEKIQKSISKEAFDKHYKLKFHQHIISVPAYLCNNLQPINEWDDNILLVSLHEASTRYDENTGFIRNFKKENSAFTF